MTDSRARSFATKTVLLLATIATAQNDTVCVRLLSESSGQAKPVGVHLDGGTATDTMT